MHHYACQLERIIDADTVVLRIDQGFYNWTIQTFRLAGLNAPERYTELGKAATEFVKEWFAKHANLTVQTDRTEKYGRWLATISGESDSGTSVLNTAIIEAGHAVPYMVEA